MFCCQNCFVDEEIRGILSTNPHGRCDFCHSEDVPVYDLSQSGELSQVFEGLLDIYSLRTDLPKSYSFEHTDLLKNHLVNHWQIFSKQFKPEEVHRLITAICWQRYEDQPELFCQPIGIREICDEEFMAENCILKQHTWQEFVEGIIKKNRFHIDYVNKKQLALFLKYATKEYKPGEIFYRARISSNGKKFPPSGIGAPPVGQARAGRINPEGISVLYLADSIDTSLYEIRARLYDFVTVGQFKLKETIKVIDFSGLNRISPFITNQQDDISFVQYAVNFECLKIIANEIARPVRNDNALEYLPTQYICDFVHSQDYDGISYLSTVRQNGLNLAVFDPSVFDCISTELFDIKGINYSYDKVVS